MRLLVVGYAMRTLLLIKKQASFSEKTKNKNLFCFSIKYAKCLKSLWLLFSRKVENKTNRILQNINRIDVDCEFDIFWHRDLVEEFGNERVAFVFEFVFDNNLEPIHSFDFFNNARSRPKYD